MATTHECPYCGSTQGLRITGRNPWTNEIVDVICEADFRGLDDGPCFDDLEALPAPRPSIDWQAWARDRMEYEDPFGYERGRRW
jgi:hypothetical protein